MSTPSVGPFADDLRARCFVPSSDVVARGPRIGAEVELIPRLAGSGAPVSIVARGTELATLPVLRRFGAERGWREERSPYGVPCFDVPGGGCVSYEPGGQIEFSTSPCPSVGALVGVLRSVVEPLRQRFAEEGIELLSVGIDPFNAVNAVPLCIDAPRYLAMDRFLTAIGTGGARMMRQAAAVQMNLDWHDAPPRQWRLLNAMAPLLVAIFANSPIYEKRETGERSFRARVWRELDGGRTGIFPGEDAVGEYLAFALAAPFLFRTDESGGFRPFAHWHAREPLPLEAWRTHLSTLFPEIRPKGYLEVRSVDAIAPALYAAPLVLLVGATMDATAAAAATALLGAPDAALLDRAGRLGVRDARLHEKAMRLWEIALDGAARLPHFVEPEMREEARTFADTYTRRGRAPADDMESVGAVPSHPCAIAALGGAA